MFKTILITVLQKKKKKNSATCSLKSYLHENPQLTTIWIQKCKNRNTTLTHSPEAGGQSNNPRGVIVDARRRQGGPVATAATAAGRGGLSGERYPGVTSSWRRRGLHHRQPGARRRWRPVRVRRRHTEDRSWGASRHRTAAVVLVVEQSVLGDR